MRKQIGNVFVSDNTYSDVLAHHGILGMRWGVRRFQRRDGSLTAAGKKRYGGYDKKQTPTKTELYDVFNDEEARNAIKSAYKGANDAFVDSTLKDQTEFLSKWLSMRNMYVHERELKPIGGIDGEVTYINNSYNDGRLYTLYLRRVPGTDRVEWDVAIDD